MRRRTATGGLTTGQAEKHTEQMCCEGKQAESMENVASQNLFTFWSRTLLPMQAWQISWILAKIVEDNLKSQSTQLADSGKK